jgi:two-component system KDP operon response regulator KdpE
MKVVVIDDSPEIIEVVSLCFQLRWSGAEVTAANDGTRGLEIISARFAAFPRCPWSCSP